MLKPLEALNGTSEISDDFITQFIIKSEKPDEQPTREQIVALLKHQNARFYFKQHLPHYCTLHLAVLKQIQNVQQFEEYVKDESLLKRMLKDNDAFYINFIEAILPELLHVAHSLKNTSVFNSLGPFVFSLHQYQYNCYLDHFIEKKACPQSHNECSVLFKCLTLLYSNSSFAGFAYKSIFHSFVSATKDFKLVYKMLIVLTELIGFSLKDSFNCKRIKSHPKEITLDASLLILSELLDVVTISNVNLECEVNGVKFNDFIVNILKSAISLTRCANVHCYMIISRAVEINPLLVESAIDEIVVYIMLNDNSSCRTEYEKLLVKILELFRKLHRFQNFVSKTIRVLKIALAKGRSFNDPVYEFKGELNAQSDETNSYDIDCILPSSALNYFSDCIVNLASWQVINLFKTVSFFLGEVEELKDTNEACVFFEILSRFTCWILLSVRMAEHTVAQNTVQKFIAALDALKTTMANFGRAILQREHNHVLMKTFLNIAYHWAEVYMTIEYYTSDETIHMEKVVDGNISACNVTYLHSYLSDKEWCLIAERIHNFGEATCKKMMQKLVVQKMRALIIFDNLNEDVVVEIVRTLSAEFEPELFDIFTDKFVANNILSRTSPEVVVGLSEIVTQDLVEGRFEMMKRPHIRDSVYLTRGILHVVFNKINKLLKQKRKHDDSIPKKATCARIIATLPANSFIDDCSEEMLEKVAEILICDSSEQGADLKTNGAKIRDYLIILTKLPVLFCPKNTQKLVVLLLFALHKDGKSELSKTCESMIISLVQYSKFTLLDIFDADVLLKMLLDSFERCDVLFNLLAQNVFKNDVDVAKFERAVEFINHNLKDSRCLKFATTVFNLLKTKNLKLSPDSKLLCQKYKTEIVDKFVKMISKKGEVEDVLVEPYILALRHFLTKDENDSLAKLKSFLHDYVEYCFGKGSQSNVRGFLLLFVTILHNKPLQLDLGEDLVLRIWNGLKSVDISNDVTSEYSQLVTLVASLIPNELFENIFEDLLKATEGAIELKEWSTFYRHLKTWTSILTTNFNPAKINVLRKQLQLLLEKLIIVLKYEIYKKELFDEVIQFEISIIQAHHVPLTAAIVDFLLLNVPILMKKTHFVEVFNASVSLLEGLLKHRNPLIMDRLPPFLLQYRLLLKELCKRSGTKIGVKAQKMQANEDCAHRFEKLTRNVAWCKKDMGRIAMYLIADILGEYELDTLNQGVKKHLNNCIYSLLEDCDQHAIAFLLRVLSNASTEMFKLLYENYKKFHRFTGKV